MATKHEGCARCGTSPNTLRHELTTAMHHLCPRSRRHPSLSRGFAAWQALVRFFALHRIKPHAPPLLRAPVNSFEFHSCELSVSAQQSAFAVGVLSDLYAFNRSTENSLCPYRTPAW
nr:ORF64d [Ipomoea batatas]